MRTGSALALALSLLACLAATASADTGAKIIERCTHGQSLSGFSQKDYRRALQELPTEVEEYSDCGNLIRRAQLAALSNGGGGGSGPSTPSAPLTPAEQRAVAQAPKEGAAPQKVGDQLISPGVVHADVASALSTLPAPLLAVLALLLACAVALGGRAVYERVRARAD
ncbi:MAG TPA: hypothetical protein VL988_11250 [Solirubrobacteraceae bacterium]|nr:hypothetical protein [Solirubrobacteraceae bacterium]